MKLQEIAARATEDSAKELVYFLERTPDDKLARKPCDTARSALNIAAECALVTSNWVEILASGTCPAQGEYLSLFSRLDDFTSREEVVLALNEATTRLTTVIRDIPDERLSEDLTMFWGETAPVGAWLHQVALHNNYHIGQIGYIQRLYGDNQG